MNNPINQCNCGCSPSLLVSNFGINERYGFYCEQCRKVVRPVYTLKFEAIAAWNCFYSKKQSEDCNAN